MIGRGALGNPWLFARLRELCAGRPDPGPPGLDERLAVFRRHVELIERLKQGLRTLHEVRKACAWYARGLYGCNALRLRVWEAPDLVTARTLVEDYFSQLGERQRRLGLAPEAGRRPSSNPARRVIGSTETPFDAPFAAGRGSRPLSKSFSVTWSA